MLSSGTERILWTQAQKVELLQLQVLLFPNSVCQEFPELSPALPEGIFLGPLSGAANVFVPGPVQNGLLEYKKTLEFSVVCIMV